MTTELSIRAADTRSMVIIEMCDDESQTIIRQTLNAQQVLAISAKLLGELNISLTQAKLPDKVQPTKDLYDGFLQDGCIVCDGVIFQDGEWWHRYPEDVDPDYPHQARRSFDGVL